MIRKSIFLPQKLAPDKVYNLLYLLKINKNCKSNKMHDPTRKLTCKTQTSYVKYGQSYVPNFLNIKHQDTQSKPRVPPLEQAQVQEPQGWYQFNSPSKKPSSAHLNVSPSQLEARTIATLQISLNYFINYQDNSRQPNNSIIQSYGMMPISVTLGSNIAVYIIACLSILQNVFLSEY